MKKKKKKSISSAASKKMLKPRGNKGNQAGGSTSRKAKAPIGGGRRP